MALVVPPDMGEYVGALAALAILDPDQQAYKPGDSVLVQPDLRTLLFIDEET